MKKMRHWQDPVNAVLGIWLVLSPWVLGLQADTTVMTNGVIVGLALIAASLGAIFVPRAWEEWTESVLGLWMVASPWLLGFSSNHDATVNAVVSGIVIMVLALWVLLTDKNYNAWWHDPAH
ncbi:SPW repeat protein [Variovorax terrae]|uniref:SPW repeat protein n=1 Tax=Variovorax terrae TaxID=2923278 RepID=A0A9X1VRZ4_9BURK|nr:SPW repeat protein [Variovorax terrae]MCJ0762238.1 SPW repeat protein [Variovorax terrae]